MTGVRVVDLNLLIYATNRDSPHHAAARAWLEGVLSEAEPVGFAWPVLLGYLRITTHPRILARPLAPEQAIAVVDGWLTAPPSRILEPGADHWPRLRELLLASGTAGNLTGDAQLAALAIENGATLCSTDADFSRFARLRWQNPLSTARGSRRGR